MALKRTRHDDFIRSALQGIVYNASTNINVATSAQNILRDLDSTHVNAFDVAVCSTASPRLCDELVAAGCVMVRKCSFKQAVEWAETLPGVMEHLVVLWESALETRDILWVLNDLAPDPSGAVVTRLLELPAYQMNWLYLVNVYAAGVRPASMAYICDKENYHYGVSQCVYLKQIAPRVVDALMKLPSLHSQTIYELHLRAARHQERSMKYVCDRSNSDASLVVCAENAAVWIDEEVLRTLSLSPTVGVNVMYRALLAQRASREYLVKWLTYKLSTLTDPAEIAASRARMALFVPERNVAKYMLDNIDAFVVADPKLPPMDRPRIDPYKP